MQDIKTVKLELIAWITHLEDNEVIEKIRALYDEYEVPEWHKELVLERVNSARPEDYISWNEAKKQLHK